MLRTTISGLVSRPRTALIISLLFFRENTSAKRFSLFYLSVGGMSINIDLSSSMASTLAL